MRIGLYGLPTAGKTHILDAVRNFKALSGSEMLLETNPEFHSASEIEKKQIREELAQKLMLMDNFIMDGHYSFGDDIAFTESDGELYDTFIYLYVSPDILKKRMSDSERNKKYLQFDIEKWQANEIESLREFCHCHDKDFYVIDNPEKGYYADISIILQFIDSIAAGFSCVKFANKIVRDITNERNIGEVCLLDGDKTLIREDSSGLVGYSTHIFDGNFYTGFQSWKHHKELTDFLRYLDYTCPSLADFKINYNEIVKDAAKKGYILTTGYLGIWKQISKELNVPIYYGDQVSAETKYYVAKFLQEAGYRVSAYGDGMNDFYMLKKADSGYLICKENGEVSKSLKDKDLEGLIIVRA